MLSKVAGVAAYGQIESKL